MAGCMVGSLMKCLWVCVRFGQCNGMVCCCVCLFVCGCVCWFGLFECLFVCLFVCVCLSVCYLDVFAGWVGAEAVVYSLLGWVAVG